jgi:glutathione S-transferase
MIVLYHGDTSVCSAKVRLALSEKSLEWSSELLSLQRGDQHRPDYAALNPARVVPTLVEDGQVVTESTIILEYLEQAYPAIPLMPEHPHARSFARLWLRRVDDLHPCCSTLSTAVKLAGLRARMTPTEIEVHLNSIPGEERRSHHTMLMREGFDALPVRRSVRALDLFAGNMEKFLGEGDYLLGNCLTLADIAALPYVNRAEVLGMSALWSKRQRVAGWLHRMRARPSYEDGMVRWAPPGDASRYKPSPELGDIAASLQG